MSLALGLGLSGIFLQEAKGAPPNPATIFGSNLVAWYAPAQIVQSGGVASSWTDLSANAATLTATGSPPYSATGINGTNPAVVLTGSNANYFVTAKGAVAIGGATATMSFFGMGSMGSQGAESYDTFITAMSTANSAHDYNNTNSAIAILRSNVSAAMCYFQNNGAHGIYNVAQSTPYRFATVFDGANVTEYLNNFQQTQVAQTLTNWGGVGINILSLGVGTPLDTNGSGSPITRAGSCWSGAIAEIIVANVAATATQRAQVDAWLVYNNMQNYSQQWISPGFYNDTDTTTYPFLSTDGLTWTQVATASLVGPGGNNGSRRDGSYLYAYGKWWLVVGNQGSYGGAGIANTFNIYSNANLLGTAAWTLVASVDCSSALSGNLSVWAPRWTVGDTDGSINLVVDLSNTGGDTGFQIYLMTATDSTLATWSTPTALTGALPANMIDASIYLIGNVYYMFYKNETTKYIEYATASAIGGPYTVVGSGNWASWGQFFEAPRLIALSGKYRIYLEDYANPSIGGANYSESTNWPASGASSTWSAPTLCTFTKNGHTDVPWFTAGVRELT